VKSYPPPVNYLIGLGDPRERPSKELDLQALGIGKEHVPLLLEMLADPQFEDSEDSEDTPESWTHLHVWRALGQLRALEAVEPLISFIEKYSEVWFDWVLGEFGDVCAQIGPDALPLLTAYLEKRAAVDMYVQSSITEAVAKIGLAHPEARDAAVATLTAVLAKYDENDEFLNGSIIGDLIDLKAVEALPLIEQAFAAGCVDEFVAGDWDEVQVEFGLKSRSPFRKRPVAPWIDVSSLREEIELAEEEEAFEEELDEEEEEDYFKPVELSPQLPLEFTFTPKQHAKIVNKRKQAAKNRKINRKKR